MQERKEFKPFLNARYTATRNEEGNYCINKNGEMMCEYHTEFGLRYFERKISDLLDRGITVEDML